MFQPYEIPVSVKGIIFDSAGKIWLRKNSRKEWELPGGKIDPDEQPEETVKREIMEEMSLSVKVGDIVDSFLIKIPDSIDESEGVLVLIYYCKALGPTGEFEITEPGVTEFKTFSISEVEKINIWPQYKTAIKKSLEKWNYLI